MESSAVAFIVRGALRADRLAVRPLSAQCGAALRSISAAVRSIWTAVRSIFTPHCGRFPPFSTAVRSANTAQGYRSAVEFRRTATSPRTEPAQLLGNPFLFIPVLYPSAAGPVWVLFS